MPFLSISVWQLFVCCRSLGSYPVLEICFSLQVYLDVEPSRQPVSRKNCESYVWSGWGSMRQIYIESAQHSLMVIIIVTGRRKTIAGRTCVHICQRRRRYFINTPLLAVRHHNTGLLQPPLVSGTSVVSERAVLYN